MSATGNAPTGDASDVNGDPWSALQKNFVYVWSKLSLTCLFLSCLYEKGFLLQDDFEALRCNGLSDDDKLTRLLVTILPRKSASMFKPFCEILCHVGQGHIVDRLLGNHHLVRLPPERKRRAHAV